MKPLAALILLMASFAGEASGLAPREIGAQVRIGERTVLGEKSPESFDEYDLVARFDLPWALSGERFALAAQWLGGAGVIESSGRAAAIVSAIPLLALGTADRRFTLDAGAGLALLSEHRYARQDMGGPLQFALTAGLEAPLYRHVAMGYRFLHYSDGGLYGGGTIGVDLHMAALLYRF